jgi:hypothetical protein
LLLVLLMIFRPKGIMGFKDPRWLRPADQEVPGGMAGGGEFEGRAEDSPVSRPSPQKPL